MTQQSLLCIGRLQLAATRVHRKTCYRWIATAITSRELVLVSTVNRQLERQESTTPSSLTRIGVITSSHHRPSSSPIPLQHDDISSHHLLHHVHLIQVQTELVSSHDVDHCLEVIGGPQEGEGEREAVRDRFPPLLCSRSRW